MKPRFLILVIGFLMSSSILRADFNSGSDGSDGAFNPAPSIEIDLDLAATGTWDMPSPVAGQGVYDPQQWAVVFKYTTIDIPAGITVTFKNHRSGAPVVWLAQGDVIILGAVNLSGERGHHSNESPYFSEGGPGAFGGARISNSGGFGPAGGETSLFDGFCGNYVGRYGNDEILPLIGGSGGSRSTQNPTSGGGAGGGAILIGSSTRIIIGGFQAISADGGSSDHPNSKGSGGAIRLIGDTVEGLGGMSASQGGYSWPCDQTIQGRIRIEADLLSYVGSTIPSYTFGPPGPIFLPINAPTLTVTTVAATQVPSDPLSGIVTPDVEIDDEGPVTLHIEATGVPPQAHVSCRIVPAQGETIGVNGPLIAQGNGISTADLVVTFPQGASEVQCRAYWQ